jgi:hypothetical protein
MRLLLQVIDEPLMFQVDAHVPSPETWPAGIVADDTKSVKQILILVEASYFLRMKQ